VNVTLHVVKVLKYGDVHVTILLQRMEVEIALCWEKMLNIEFVKDDIVQVSFCISSFLLRFYLDATK
jgi:hypothetical protein